MDKSRAASIDLSALSSELEKAVTELQSTEGTAFTFIHNPGIIGFVAPADQLNHKTLSEVSRLASSISAKAGPLAGPANIVLGSSHITIGFVSNESMSAR